MIFFSPFPQEFAYTMIPFNPFYPIIIKYLILINNPIIGYFHTTTISHSQFSSIQICSMIFNSMIYDSSAF